MESGTGPARGPWRNKRRWRFAIGLWLLPAYFASEGPAVYCVTRGWMPKGLFTAAYVVPMGYVWLPEPVDDAFGYYLTWCRDEAWRHMGRPWDATNR